MITRLLFLLPRSALAALMVAGCTEEARAPAELVRGRLHAELIDSATNPTRCFGMHCCPAGFGVRGLDVSQNRLLCREVNQQAEDCFVDHATVRAGMHACPVGTYLRGIEVSRNLLTCCYDRRRGFSEHLSEAVDPAPGQTPHTASDMHACPVTAPGGDAFMSGVHPGDNRFLCVQAPAVPSPIAEPVDIDIDPQQPRTFSRFFPTTGHGIWKRALQNWLSRLFDLPPNRSYVVPPAVTVVASQSVEGNVTSRRIQYPSAADGSVIPAYLLLPPGYAAGGSYRGALLLHGHFAEAKQGAAVDWNSPMHALALYLAQQGFVTLAPDTRTWGEFPIPGQGTGGHNQATDLLRSRTTGNLGQLPRLTLLDNLTSVGVLAATPGVTSVAVEGLSLGAHQAMWLAAVDNRVGDVVLAGNFLSFGCLNDPARAHLCQTVPGLSSSLSSPGSSLLLEASDVAGLIAPRRLHSMWGSEDRQPLDQTPAGSGEACSQTAARDTRSVYNALGIGGAFLDGASAPVPGMHHELDPTSTLRFFTGASPDDQRDYGTQCNGMHCCPPGKALGGVQVSSNDLLCRDVVPAAFETCYVDPSPGTQRQGMHACAPGHYLRGVHVGDNRLTCCRDQRLPNTLTGPEAVEASTLVQGMRACPAARRFATGLHAASNLLLCQAP